MEPLLFLTHRVPFPANKGDSIRSSHLLRHLAARYAVHMGTFAESDEDTAGVERLAAFCASYHVEPLHSRTTRMRSVAGFFSGEALTLPYYRSAALKSWIRMTVETVGITKSVVFSGAMAQFVEDLPQLRIVLNFVDVDSAKWSDYAERHPWPMSSVYRREGERLLSFERHAAARTIANAFVTKAEADLFRSLAPECAHSVKVVEMGIETDALSPDPERPSPFARDEAAIVFTGVMDYWPNVDAMVWFESEILPLILKRRPDARLYIVGMNPAPSVRRLARNPRVVVTGRVPDTRPYLQHAAVVVAPLRVARGIQTKVLEAMAMARPVVVSTAVARVIRAVSGRDLETAADAAEFASKVLALLAGENGEFMGASARATVTGNYGWSQNLAAFDASLDALDSAEPRQASK